MKNKIESIFPLVSAVVVVIISFIEPGIVVEVSVGLFILISLYAFVTKKSS